MDSERGYRRLVKNVNGVFSSLWEHEAGYEVGRAYELAIVAVGPVLRGFLDGVPMFVVEDEELATGRVGLYCWGDADARFARVQVFPAGAAFDDRLLDEAFDTVAPGRWTVVDEGDVEGPSDWQVSGSELRQTANIHGGSQAGADPEKPGTHVVAGEPAWRDHRLTVVRQSDADDAIGAIVRYADYENYYRLSLDRERGYRRPVKRVNGVVTVLWEDDVRVRARAPVRAHARRAGRRAHRSPGRHPALPGARSRPRRRADRALLLGEHRRPVRGSACRRGRLGAPLPLRPGRTAPARRLTRPRAFRGTNATPGLPRRTSSAGQGASIHGKPGEGRRSVRCLFCK